MEFLTGPRRRSRGNEFRIADVFCSVGGLTLGASEALIEQGFKPVVSFASDLASDALAVYEKNFKPLVSIQGSMDDLVKPLSRMTRMALRLIADCVRGSAQTYFLLAHHAKGTQCLTTILAMTIREINCI